ncbi:cytochrome P450 6B2-like [Choristoneura fumiferana]|uniref:cytochrome P450 6B2-like n=1 Tax=Choristoneura fumiferana TaxID=7141 RepID=UPI003D15E6D2
MIHLMIIGSIIVAFYFYTTRTFKYWEKKGVKYDKPIPIFGNMAPSFLAQKTISQLVEKLYWKYPEEKVVGLFWSSNPELLVRDPDIIKRIWTTDFDYFYSRGLYETDNDHRNVELLRKNLLVVEGDIWRLLRHSTTPAFTSCKLKAMFPLIVERAERLQERTRTISAGGQPVDARDLMARYSTDFIGACGLGIGGDALHDEDSNFRKLGARIFQVCTKKFLTIMLKTFFPYTFRHAKVHGIVEKDFCDLVNKILKERNYKPSGRHDFIDLMLEIKAKGKMECKSMEKMKPDGTPERVSMEMDDELIAAQVFIFFAAGFETSASSSSYTLHEIAYNPKVQKKIQEEIDQVLANYNNKLSYDAIKEMRYLEWAFQEGMRVLPPAGRMIRTCRKKYTFPDLELTIEEGTRVVISTQALHNDPKYWDRPDDFRPERFSPECNEPKHKFAFLPFGSGPRACIGERLGLIQSLAGLAAILSQFSVVPAPATVRCPLLDPTTNIVQGIIGGLPLIFTPRT